MAGPDRDAVRHVQHLLRHVDDARALRRNPLVTQLFDDDADGTNALACRSAVAHVRTKILTAAKMLLSERAEGRRSADAARRQYQIIMRCDLGSELHRVVGAELGLSHRQFYRERLRACARLAELLADAPTPLEQTVQALPTEFELRLNCAAGLRNHGQLDAALTLLNTLAAESATPEDRIRAWCEVAAVQCDAGRVQQAREALDRAWRVHGCMDLSEDRREICAAEIHRVMSAVDWASGSLREGMAVNDHALAALHSSGALNSERGIELAALITISLACQYREMGNTGTSLGLLEQARDLVERLRDPAPALRASLSGNIATTYALTTGGISAALDQLRRQLEFVKTYNLQRESVDALATLCLVYVQRRDFSAALKYGRSALALARTISSAEDFAYCALNVSRVETMCGRGTSALNLVGEVRSRIEPEGTMGIFADMSEAEALLSMRAYARGLKLAARCAAKFELLGMERYLGSALRIQAEALAALGRIREAAAAIDSALEVLERRGHMFSLAQAYETSAKVTGERRHALAADELFAIIGA